MSSDEVFIHLLPGGAMPRRLTEGSIGYDVSIRAIVSAVEMDPQSPALRKTLFDFEALPQDASVARHVCHGANGEMVYAMDPHESVLVGIGFATAMEFPMFYWVAPRSGLASKWGITVTNAPGTVDPDYRGEAGVLVFNRNEYPFDLCRGMRIAQIIFQLATIPLLRQVEQHADLPATLRGSGGFGSTGLK